MTTKRMSFFDKYLTDRVALTCVFGVLVEVPTLVFGEGVTLPSGNPC
jgi:ACR3 family arsenite efflux pump ArsB